ncbi:MAG: DinB family protein [Candidatus Limnocylindrales bacterium]
MPEPLLSEMPFPPVALHEAVPAGRAAIIAAGRDLLAVDDASLERGWPWHHGIADVRYGFYRGFETLEAAAADVRATLEQAGTRPAAGARAAAGATEARWDLHGRLLALAEDALDASAGGNEWTVRQTCAHIISSQHSYALYSAWWLLRRDAPTLADQAPEDLGFPVPTEEEEGRGSLAEIRARLDRRMDDAMAAFGGLDDGAVAVPGRWAGFPVDLRFRLGRWASHAREHTVQVDKTLAMIGWSPREVDRLVGLMLSAWGRLEAEVFGLPAAALDRPASGGTAAEIVAAAARKVAADAATVRAAATG